MLWLVPTANLRHETWSIAYHETNLVIGTMADKTPQNPIFTVGSGAYEACLPKVICGNCGTVIGLRTSRKNPKMRCPNCETLLEIRQEAGRFCAIPVTPTNGNEDDEA